MDDRPGCGAIFDRPMASAAMAFRHDFSISRCFQRLLWSGLSGSFFRPTSSTAALVMVFVPIYQWLALTLLLVLCFGPRDVPAAAGEDHVN
jgi:hypothetical protein